MDQIANTPKPPYYTVIFTSVRTDVHDGYADTAAKMISLASGMPGFLGVESVRDPEGLGITVSYWKDEKSIRDWKNHTAHVKAQQFGKEKWYRNYKIRIAKVDKDYGF